MIVHEYIYDKWGSQFPEIYDGNIICASNQFISLNTEISDTLRYSQQDVQGSFILAGINKPTLIKVPQCFRCCSITYHIALILKVNTEGIFVNLVLKFHSLITNL